jgi:ComF family protein
MRFSSTAKLHMFTAETANLIYDAALALFYPQACALCGAGVDSRFDGVVCDDCWADTRIFSAADLLCWKCGTPVRTNVSPLAVEQPALINCRRCDAESFMAARACGPYEGALRASVIALKREADVSRRLTRLMFETCGRAPLNSATLIVPVPLHPQRQKERGFNQAALLAHSLSARLRLPVEARSLCRREHTGRHRAGMDARARRESVERAFAVVHPRAIANEHVLLVDDVFTSGATVSACARALLDAGAREVSVLTIARASTYF